jgi:hypothetical protein
VKIIQSTFFLLLFLSSNAFGFWDINKTTEHFILLNEGEGSSLTVYNSDISLSMTEKDEWNIAIESVKHNEKRYIYLKNKNIKGMFQIKFTNKLTPNNRHQDLFEIGIVDNNRKKVIFSNKIDFHPMNMNEYQNKWFTLTITENKISLALDEQVINSINIENNDFSWYIGAHRVFQRTPVLIKIISLNS